MLVLKKVWKMKKKNLNYILVVDYLRIFIVLIIVKKFIFNL